MSEVSGIGYYSTEFNWQDTRESSGAVLLTFKSLQDQVTQVSVNNQTFDQVNIVCGCVDISQAVKTGANNISIKVVSGLFNRALASNAKVFSAHPRQINGKSPIDYGLTGATISY